MKWFRPQSYYDSGAWRGTWELDGGGALIETQAIHSVDLLTWLMGPVVGNPRADRPPRPSRIAVEDTPWRRSALPAARWAWMEASTAAILAT